MKKIRQTIYDYISELIMDEPRRVRAQLLLLYYALAIISLGMTVLNIVTKKGVLTSVTALFAVIMAVNVFLTFRGTAGQQIAQKLAAGEVILLLTFFIVSGIPDGFSANWVLIMPSTAMFLFGIKNGTLECMIMLVIMVFFYWTPFGKSLLRYEYGATYMMRVPLLYVALFIISLMLQTLTRFAFSRYYALSEMDPLTGAYNRRGFENYITRSADEFEGQRCLFMICDLDFFKRINDQYGHFVGDVVLQKSLAFLKDEIGLPACRWGGEEFAFAGLQDFRDEDFMKNVCRQFQENVINVNGIEIKMTVSIGVISTRQPLAADSIVAFSQQADACLYTAKETGRNKVVFKSLD